MEQESLFYQDLQDPLASRLRPQSLEDYVGQKHLIGKGKVLWNLIEKDQVTNPALLILVLSQVAYEKSNKS